MLSVFILAITIHWGFATGALLARITNWSIPRFLIIILLIKYFMMTYAIQN